MRLCILDLLPEKPEAETQWLRGMAFSEFDAEVTFFMVESHRPTHTSPEYLRTFYRTLSQMAGEYYDGMIVTGTMLEPSLYPDGDHGQWMEGVDPQMAVDMRKAVLDLLVEFLPEFEKVTFEPSDALF